MIRFTCGHCGRSVRVDDSFAGRKGRCPSCRQVVSIPASSSAPPDQAGDADGDIGALAAAAEGGDRRGETDLPVPPPPAVREARIDEASFAPDAKDPAGETDILPADQGDRGPGSRGPVARAARRAAERRSAPQAVERACRQRKKVILLAGLVVVVAAVLALLLLIR